MLYGTIKEKEKRTNATAANCMFYWGPYNHFLTNQSAMQRMCVYFAIAFFNTKNKANSSLRTFWALVTRDQYNHKEGWLYNGKKETSWVKKGQIFALISQNLSLNYTSNETKVWESFTVVRDKNGIASSHSMIWQALTQQSYMPREITNIHENECIPILIKF